MNKELSSTFLKCLEVENKSDIEQTSELLLTNSPKALALKGVAILNLVISNIKTGISGKVLVELKNDLSTNLTSEIVPNDVKIGDVVKINNKNSNNSSSKLNVEGTVYKLNKEVIVLLIDSNHEEKIIELNKKNVWIVKITNTIVFKRLKSTMEKLERLEVNNEIVQLLINDKRSYAPPPPQPNQPKLNYINPNLNQSQQEAVKFSMENIISIIHGPPGTGKTFTLIEIVQQLLLRNSNERILICGSSNVSVDVILERLIPLIMPAKKNGKFTKSLLVRVGNGSKLQNDEFNLDNLITKNENFGILNDIRKEINALINNTKKSKTKWKDVKELRKELKLREGKIITEIILNSKVVLATLHGCSSKELLSIYKTYPNMKLFNTLIIDEISQSLEPQCWIPLINHSFDKLILAGDNHQLSPTIKSTDPKVVKVLSTTLFDRLVAQYGDAFKKFLNIQYRMNDLILKFPSKEFYNGELLSDDGNKDISLLDFDTSSSNTFIESKVVWYDTQGDDFPEQMNTSSDSKYNEMECKLVRYHIEGLLGTKDGGASAIEESHIGVLSPYSSQVSKLKQELSEFKGIEVNTIDGFQGQEKQVIIISLVRSNEKKNCGFLNNYKRINVAITRAKRQLCIIGDMDTLSGGGGEGAGAAFLKHWCEFAMDEFDVVYASNIIHEI